MPLLFIVVWLLYAWGRQCGPAMLQRAENQRCLANSTGDDHKVHGAGSQPLGAELSRKTTTHGFKLRHSLSCFAIKFERPHDDPSGRVKGGNVARGSPAGKILLPSGDIY